MAWRALLISSVAMIVLGASVWLWKSKGYRTSPAASAAFTDTISIPHLYAGGEPPATLPAPDETNTHEELNGQDVSEGMRLYSWFNCNGCHNGGGGGIGPALMDDQWIYGSAPRNIYASILEGRPNGMPSFRGKIPDAQVWQLVAYIRSMSGHAPVTARVSRSDDMDTKKADTLRKKEPAHAVEAASGTSK